MKFLIIFVITVTVASAFAKQNQNQFMNDYTMQDYTENDYTQRNPPKMSPSETNKFAQRFMNWMQKSQKRFEELYSRIYIPTSK